MISNITSTLRRNWLFVGFIIFFCALQYIVFFRGGSLILGAEGNYWHDFTIYLKNQGVTWVNIGTGEINASINSFFVFPLLFSFIKNIYIQSYLLGLILYLLPFMSMYFVLTAFKKNTQTYAALLSFFYIANPFSIIYLSAINPWNMNILFTYPIFLLIFYKWYNKYIPLFFYLGLASSLLAYTLTNPPQMALFILSQPFLMLVASQLNTKKFNWLDYVKNLCVVGVSFLSFNLWWVLHWIVVMPDTQRIYTFKFAKAWLNNQAEVTPMILKNIFSFLWLNPRTPNYSIMTDYFNHPAIQTAMYIPFVIIFLWIISEMRSSPRKKFAATLFVGMFVIVLFLKGINPPFANIISACFDYVRYCYIFKTAPEKFGVVFVFLTTIVLFFITSESKNKIIQYGLFLYIFLLFVPFIGGFYLPDIKVDTNKYATKKYYDYPEFKRFREYMASKKLDMRLISLPNAGNYQILMHLHDNKFYTGHNPLMMNIPQSYIADHTSDDYIPLFKNIDSKVTPKMWGLFSVRYISVNTRINSWFGNFTGKTPAELKKLLGHDYRLIYKDKDISLYENSKFLPHLWVPDSVIPLDASSTLDDMYKILEDYNPSMNVAFIPQEIEMGSAQPIIEYRKINETKYKIIAHGVSGQFPLIFSDNFHVNWILYNKKIEDFNQNATNQYHVYKNNESDQATEDEVLSYVNNGWISTTSNGLFISKKIGTTIQNDNLPDGGLFETDDKNSVIEVSAKNHLHANMYANAWLIDPALCNNTRCKINSDGTYDMEFVLEFWPQKRLYRNLIYTGIIVALSSIIFTVWFFRKKKS